MSEQTNWVFHAVQDADGFWRTQIGHTSMGFIYGEAIAADAMMSIERAKAMANGLDIAYNGTPDMASQQVKLLAEAFEKAMGRLEDMMMGDDGQAWSETERAMPALRAVRDLLPTMERLRDLEHTI